jgi:hypothetical protein
LTESSGLLFIDGTFITHNDSGNPPFLYEIDTTTGLPSRTVYVANATNIDWEDLAADNDYIYIGDFGNNQGTRQNLRIYKVALADYWAGDTVFADTISFNYADQTSFTPAPFQTNYDCEAMISRGDSLYVFTKQWGTLGTRAYALPKTPGNYTTSVYDSIAITSGFVTGAEWREFGILTTLDLIVNTPNAPVLYTFGGQSGRFSDKFWDSDVLQVFGSIQVEGICRFDGGHFAFSSEAFGGQKAMLSRLVIPFGLEEASPPRTVTIFPNPTSDFVTLVFRTINSGAVTVYDAGGKKHGTKPFEHVGEWQVKLPNAGGVYFLEVIFEDGHRSVEKIVKN